MHWFEMGRKGSNIVLHVTKQICKLKEDELIKTKVSTEMKIVIWRWGNCLSSTQVWNRVGQPATHCTYSGTVDHVQQRHKRSIPLWSKLIPEMSTPFHYANSMAVGIHKNSGIWQDEVGVKKKVKKTKTKWRKKNYLQLSTKTSHQTQKKVNIGVKWRSIYLKKNKKKTREQEESKKNPFIQQEQQHK